MVKRNEWWEEEDEVYDDEKDEVEELYDDEGDEEYTDYGLFGDLIALLFIAMLVYLLLKVF